MPLPYPLTNGSVNNGAEAYGNDAYLDTKTDGLKAANADPFAGFTSRQLAHPFSGYQMHGGIFVPHSQAGADWAAQTPLPQAAGEIIVYKERVRLSAGQRAAVIACYGSVRLMTVGTTASEKPYLKFYVDSTLLDGQSMLFQASAGEYIIENTDVYGSPLFPLTNDALLSIVMASEGAAGTPAKALGLAGYFMIKTEHHGGP